MKPAIYPTVMVTIFKDKNLRQLFEKKIVELSVESKQLCVKICVLWDYLQVTCPYFHWS